MSDKLEILIVDLETTGFSHTKDEILEIGIVKLDLFTGRKAKIFDNLIRPTDSMDREYLEKCWIVKNGAIKIEELEKSYSLEEFRDLIQYIFDSFPNGITAFNNAFDFGFLEAKGFKLYNKLSCPMKLSTDVCKIPGKYKTSFKWPNVDEAYKFFFPDTEYLEIHRGGDDAYHEADIVKALYDINIFKL